MISIVLLLSILGWILYRLVRSTLSVENRRLMAKHRFVALALALAFMFSLLLELQVGRSIIRLDPRIDVIAICLVWLVVWIAGEWLGE
ncbi:MAG: hypothetical protein H7Y17_16530 [Chlorobia bacterium]|nr:hypothetical protein [Fimbriimonadaceae bacterium]